MKTTKKLTKDCFKDFIYRDSDFDEWLPKMQPAKEGTVTVHQLPRDMTFKEMAIHFLGSDDVETIKKHTLTLPMIEEMIRTRENELELTGWSNFVFVENDNGSGSVAYVFRYGAGRHWDADVFELSLGGRWRADSRLIVCNLETSALSSSVPTFEKLSETYEHKATNIKIEVSDGKFTLTNGKNGTRQFTFQNSTKERLELIGNALLEISKII